MDTVVAKKMWATLESVHAMIYFVPEGFDAWERLGFPHRGMGYFASRSAAMGRVEAPVVTATFYNFNPETVARFIPAAWEIASPADVLEARYRAVDDALRRILGEAVDSPEMQWAATVADEAAAVCLPEGRALFAAHAALPYPEDPHLRLWHTLTLLREFRGDGHVMALVDAGLSGREAVISYAATGELFDADFYRRSRGWSREQWAEGEESLRERGWLDADGNLTEAGRAGRDQIEDHTNRLAIAPWEKTGEDKAAELRATVRPWSRAIVAAGGFGQSPT